MRLLGITTRIFHSARKVRGRSTRPCARVCKRPDFNVAISRLPRRSARCTAAFSSRRKGHRNYGLTGDQLTLEIHELSTLELPYESNLQT
jgi:hypothetical protein